MDKKIATKNKVYCTELLFVEQAESELNKFALQDMKSPYSDRFKSVVSKMKIVSV